ncbi:MAG TPA: ABC transporter ATP-binding protein [Acidimicrobiales bacterium]|nr:ABC transporter ATP-binding protein [Acidimicrobiales bacterium]
MTPSPDGRGGPAAEEMPRGLPAMWRLCRLGYQHEPLLLVSAFVLSLVAAVPDALLALWLALLGEGVVRHRRGLVLGAAVGLALSSAATWFLRTISVRIQRRFRDKVTIALESHVAGLQASVSTIAHQERPDYLDRLAVLRDQVFVLDHMYMSLFTTAGWILRLALTVALLASIHPALVLLAFFAAPTVVTSSWRPTVERAVQEHQASHDRLARHLFLTATTASAGKEVRVTGIGDQLVEGRRRAWEQWYGPVAAARWATAAWHSLAWAVFGLAYVAGVVSVAYALHGSVAAVLLVLAAGARLSSYIGGAVGEIGFLRGTWLDGSKRLVWLERYAQETVAQADTSPPFRLTDGIRLEHVSFAYPGTDRLVLQDVSLHLPAGAVVAVVGENGAGKSTLVKLLCQMYEPTDGEILVDGTALRTIIPEQWRARLAGAFQDFFRFELVARQSVGVGDVALVDDVPAVGAAVGRAGADDVVARLVKGLDTQLGPTWPEGVDVSFGQWQKLALARGFMRQAPLLLVLDEPTAALDAETEHALFERYAEVARGDNSAGQITVLVSHRFSTVRMADLIVVLDGARVVEAGSHDELVARDGPYAELYGIQAASYR